MDMSSFLCGPISLLVALEPVMRRRRSAREAMAALQNTVGRNVLTGRLGCTVTSATSVWLSKRMKLAFVGCDSDLCIAMLAHISREIS